jgi:S-formylglutathione hydrolase
MKTVSIDKSHGGIQGVYSRSSQAYACEMSFAVFVPPQARTASCPVLWYLSGLTCTHANVIEKGEYRWLAGELGLITVCPYTSPRGDTVPDEPNNWQFGKGAGFNVDATQEPYATNYRMYSYSTEELPELIAKQFPADMSRQSIFGHSMGGHGGAHDRTEASRPFQELFGLCADLPSKRVGLVEASVREIPWSRPGYMASLRCMRADRG